MFKRRDKRSWLTLLGRSFWPRGGWGRAFAYVWHRLRRLPDPPHKVARGIAAGVFTCFTPLYGFHFLLAGSIAWVLRGSILAALLSTLFGNPVTFPLIATVNMNIGNWMLGRDSSLPVGQILASFGHASAEMWRNTVALFTHATPHWDKLAMFFDQVFLPYLIGGIIPGAIAGFVAYLVSEPVVRAYRNRRQKRLSARKSKRSRVAPATSPARAEEP